MRSKYLFLSFIFLSIVSPFHVVNAKTGCGDTGVWLQVLGSGGPEIDDGRASSGNIIWRDGKARILIDIGSGSMFRFEQSGASANDLDVILLTHMHVDHANDLPALIKAFYFTGRSRDITLYGPTGNQRMPSTTEFVQNLFGPEGAYRYLKSYLHGHNDYQLIPNNVNASGNEETLVVDNSQYRLTAVPVHHGPIPTVAWRVDIAGKTIVFSGDMSNQNETLAKLAKQADLLVANNTIPEGAKGISLKMHMPPSVIGKIAQQAQVKQLVLSHRMNGTLGKEKQSTEEIRKQYAGPIQFADDLQCFKLE